MGRALLVAYDGATVLAAIAGLTLANGVTDLIADTYTALTAVVGAVTKSITVLTLPTLVARTSTLCITLTMIVARECTV